MRSGRQGASPAREGSSPRRVQTHKVNVRPLHLAVLAALAALVLEASGVVKARPAFDLVLESARSSSAFRLAVRRWQRTHKVRDLLVAVVLVDLGGVERLGTVGAHLVVEDGVWRVVALGQDCLDPVENSKTQTHQCRRRCRCP